MVLKMAEQRDMLNAARALVESTQRTLQENAPIIEQSRETVERTRELLAQLRDRRGDR